MKSSIKSLVFILALSAMPMAAIQVFAQQPTANSLLGTTDIPAYIEEVPELAPSLEQTTLRAMGENPLQPDHQALDNFYRPAEDKIRRVLQQYEDFYKKKMESAAPDMEAMNQEIERNPIVKGMGGVQAIQAMSQEEAEAAARQSAAQYIADPFAANGVNSPGMTALYQKMMSDPAYAKRFEKMSEQERMAELQKYMANDPVLARTPEMEQERNQQMAQRDKVTDAMEINEKITALTQEIYAVQYAYGQSVQTLETQAGSHAEIEAEFWQRYNALPEIVAGEAGRMKDPELEKKLRIEIAARHRERAAADLEQYIVLLGGLKEQYKQIATAYMQFISANAYRVNGNPADLYNGTNTEFTLANFELSLLGLGLEIIKQSRDFSWNLASWEQRYREVMRSYEGGN